jgi:glutamate 5-kinase
MTSARKPLAGHRRIVVKIGSALLVDRGTGLRSAWLDAICADIAALRQQGADVLVVSSGAIAMGRTVLDLPSGALKLEESQAAAAVGQIALARAWSESLSHQNIIAGQILLTLGDTEERSVPCRSSTRTTPSPPPRSAMATMTGWLPAWRP